MEPDRLSLRADAASVYGDQRAEYLAQLVAPMDDMWAAFADTAAPHALMVGDEVAGSCSVDEKCQLLRFYVLPRFQQRSVTCRICGASFEVNPRHRNAHVFCSARCRVRSYRRNADLPTEGTGPGFGGCGAVRGVLRG